MHPAVCTLQAEGAAARASPGEGLARGGGRADLLDGGEHVRRRVGQRAALAGALGHPRQLLPRDRLLRRAGAKQHVQRLVELDAAVGIGVEARERGLQLRLRHAKPERRRRCRELDERERAVAVGVGLTERRLDGVAVVGAVGFGCEVKLDGERRAQLRVGSRVVRRVRQHARARAHDERFVTRQCAAPATKTP